MFYQALLAGRRTIEHGATDAKEVQAIMEKGLREEPAIRIDYLAVCDPDTLEPLERIDRQAVILGAIRLGSVRLIDNVLAKRKQKTRR
jgi:pantoate--beta-alanine ligase